MGKRGSGLEHVLLIHFNFKSRRLEPKRIYEGPFPQPVLLTTLQS